jgi:predicted MFS family arabinose efflux permease
MQFLGGRALAVGFALQVIGFSAVMLVACNILPRGLGLGLSCAGLGVGTVMPSVIKVVISGSEPCHAGLVSGIMISTFQIGAALGVAIIGGVFYAALGTGESVKTYAHAFTLALGCNVVLLALAGVLSLRVSGEPEMHQATPTVSKAEHAS